MKIIEKEFNALTGETTITERDETLQEETERLNYLAKVEADKKTAEEKLIARQAVLDRLGLTADEAALLLS